MHVIRSLPKVTELGIMVSMQTEELVCRVKDCSWIHGGLRTSPVAEYLPRNKVLGSISSNTRKQTFFSPDTYLGLWDICSHVKIPGYNFVPFGDFLLSSRITKKDS